LALNLVWYMRVCSLILCAAATSPLRADGRRRRPSAFYVTWPSTSIVLHKHRLFNQSTNDDRLAPRTADVGSD